MTSTSELLWTWAPRVLGVLLALFVSVFALDVFSEGRGFWGTLVALVMHMIPTAIAVAVLAIAWRWRVAGGMLYLALAIVYAIPARNHLAWIVAISGPLVLTGVLFLLSSLWTTSNHAGATR